MPEIDLIFDISIFRNMESDIIDLSDGENSALIAKNPDEFNQADIRMIFMNEKKQHKQFVFKEHFGTNGMQKLYFNKDCDEKQAYASGRIKHFVQCIKCDVIMTSTGNHLK